MTSRRTAHRPSCRVSCRASCRALIAAALAAAVVVLAPLPAGAHPTPAAVRYRWELEFEPGPLRLYVDPLESRAYWYFTYQVTNRTGRNQVWAPSFTLYTDAGEILEGGREVPFRVVTDLLDLMRSDLIEDQNQIIGDILHGREHAKEGLIVWPADDVQVNRMELFIAGISGETARVRNPVSGEEVILRKTLQIDYLIRGNALSRGSKPVEEVDRRWIMR